MPDINISVIIPTYDRLWSLPKAIESCRNTECVVEIIVVDDGSSDGTLGWLQKQKNIVILQQQHQGKCWAVNKAFNLAKGKYVRFLDSDDELAEGTIDEQYEMAEANFSDIVVSGYQLKNENNEILRLQSWIECDDFIAQQLGECDSSHYSAYLFKKSFIENIPHRPDFAYRDDRLFVLEAALKQPKVAIHPGFALLHTQHQRSRLQERHGIQQVVQNFQHLNIYKMILGQLQQSGELTHRRIKASENVLWPLCHWVAKTDINEAEDVFKWITALDPAFKVPDSGMLGIMYRKLGFKLTEQILSVRRQLKYG